MAFRQIINKVLTRLREGTISSDWTGAINDSTDVDDYQSLIGEFVNETKDTVEDSWNWGVLRGIITVSTVASTVAYTLSTLGSRSRILQVIDDTNNSTLQQISDELFYHYTYVGSSTNSKPLYYRLKGNTVSFYPTPDAAYNIRIHAVDPQEDLTTAVETLTVPENLVVLGAYALALNERGEDGGTASDTAAQRFSNSLNDAINQDRNRTVDEILWYAS
tara:strand:+ start:677 stop:1333 length:657 start_codon:yes stop_codon:yes gene_type:complete